jgi:uncharacterized membrane protein YgcG
MQCPYCRTPLRETSSECPSCRLTLGRAKVLLGPVPRLTAGICDSTRLLGARGTRRVRNALERLRRRFPQVNPQIVMREFSGEQPFELQVFWLFNAGNFASEEEKGPANRAVLLAIDPPNTRAALMVGYGLEPFIADEALNHLLDLADPAWRSGRYAEGILTVLRGLDSLLTTVIESLPDTVGLPEEQVPEKRPADF